MPVYYPASKKWTSEEDRQLAILWQADWPASQIAAHIGTGRTKNSVIGRANRLGLEPRINPVPRKTRAEEIRDLRVKMKELDAGIEAARKAILEMA